MGRAGNGGKKEQLEEDRRVILAQIMIMNLCHRVTCLAAAVVDSHGPAGQSKGQPDSHFVPLLLMLDVFPPPCLSIFASQEPQLK